MEDKVILTTNPNIVEYKKDIEGWVGNDGNYYGQNKDLAILRNATHKKCDRGHIFEIGWFGCPKCKEIERPERYKKLEFKEWDGETPLKIFESDNYFFDEESIFSYAKEIGKKVEDLELVICRPNYLTPILEDYWQDVLPEDMHLDEIVSKKLLTKIKELNTLIEKEKPVSWEGSQYRTKIK